MRDIEHFLIKLFHFFPQKQCAKDKPGNVIVSPLSVSSALALLSQASAGSTLEQLRQGLHIGNDKSTVANQFLEHREQLEKSAGAATLEIANRIYVQQGHKLNKNFEEIAVSKFESGIESLNFAEAKKSAETINHFVDEQTHGKIKELFKPDQLNSDTRSVLVNAIYFKGNWEKKFNKDFTRKNDFYNSDTEKVTVDYMYLDNYFNWTHIKELESMALELNYANSNISFVVVMPTSRTGLAALEAKLKDYNLAKIVEDLKPKRWLFEIPKFKVEFDINLKNVLINVRKYAAYFYAFQQTNRKFSIVFNLFSAFSWAFLKYFLAVPI